MQIQTIQLTKAYGSTFALSKLDFHLKEGEIYGLIGKNGAGKSTLMRLIMGLSPVTSGEIYLQGSSDPAGLRAGRRNMGFALTTKFIPYLNAEDNLRYFSKLRGQRDQGEIARLLEEVGLKGKKKPVKTYSMGMEKRLALANAFLGRPDTVLLDEPINGLDPEGIVHFRQWILDKREKEGVSFLISSHILSELSLLCDRFGFLDQGELLQEISREELHALCRNSLLLRTDDPQKTAALLNELGITDFQVDHDQSLEIFQAVSSEMLLQKLVQAGIGVQELHLHELSLEEFFLQQIGGKDA